MHVKWFDDTTIRISGKISGDRGRSALTNQKDLRLLEWKAREERENLLFQKLLLMPNGKQGYVFGNALQGNCLAEGAGRQKVKKLKKLPESSEKSISKNAFSSTWNLMHACLALAAQGWCVPERWIRFLMKTSLRGDIAFSRSLKIYNTVMRLLASNSKPWNPTSEDDFELFTDALKLLDTFEENAGEAMGVVIATGKLKPNGNKLVMARKGLLVVKVMLKLFLEDIAKFRADGQVSLKWTLFTQLLESVEEGNTKVFEIVNVLQYRGASSATNPDGSVSEADYAVFSSERRHIVSHVYSLLSMVESSIVSAQNLSTSSSPPVELSESVQSSVPTVFECCVCFQEFPDLILEVDRHHHVEDCISKSA